MFAAKWSCNDGLEAAHCCSFLFCFTKLRDEGLASDPTMVSWERFEPDTTPVQTECSNHYAMLLLTTAPQLLRKLSSDPQNQKTIDVTPKARKTVFPNSKKCPMKQNFKKLHFGKKNQRRDPCLSSTLASIKILLSRGTRTNLIYLSNLTNL